jgi:RNA recognition motif-containing protein
LKQDHFLDDKLLDTKRTEPRKDGKQDVVEKIFVGGLPLHIDMETLKEYFEGFGTVLDTRLMLDKMTGTSRGFGYVTFEDVETIREILEKQQKSGIRIGGKKVDIKYARAKQLVKEFQPPAPRKRAPSVQEKIIKIPRYDDNGTPYSLPESLVVFGNPVFAKVDDGDIVLPKWPFDHPLEEVVVLNKI